MAKKSVKLCEKIKTVGQIFPSTDTQCSEDRVSQSIKSVIKSKSLIRSGTNGPGKSQSH